MALDDLAPELIHHIYNNLATISDVINLSLTCHRLNYLLRHAQKLPTLFSAAEREYGPVEDIVQLVTYNNSQPAHLRRQPIQSYSLLRQVIRVGSVAHKIEEIYPSRRWQDDYLNRRTLRPHETYALRRAVYRYWLYCEAFHNRNYPRTQRLFAGAVEERSQLLRQWTSDELFELEDIRATLEDLISSDLCPSNGAIMRHLNDSLLFTNTRQAQSWQSWPPTHMSLVPRFSNLFYDSQEDRNILNAAGNQSLPVAQRRKLQMTGWGDEISQYDVVQAMLKLNPAQIMSLYEQAVNKGQVEAYISYNVGDDWFWNNGQTLLDTWTLVLVKRGYDSSEVRDDIMQGALGVATNGSAASSRADESSNCGTW